MGIEIEMEIETCLRALAGRSKILRVYQIPQANQNYIQNAEILFRISFVSTLKRHIFAAIFRNPIINLTIK